MGKHNNEHKNNNAKHQLEGQDVKNQSPTETQHLVSSSSPLSLAKSGRGDERTHTHTHTHTPLSQPSPVHCDRHTCDGKSKLRIHEGGHFSPVRCHEILGDVAGERRPCDEDSQPGKLGFKLLLGDPRDSWQGRSQSKRKSRQPHGN